MHFNVLNYLLIFILIIKATHKSDSLQAASSRYILNEVSDFNDIVEKEAYQGGSLPINNQKPHQYSYETVESDNSHDNVFSSPVLNDKSKLCPKHDIKHREPFRLLPQKEESDDQGMVRLMPKHDGHRHFKSYELGSDYSDKNNLCPKHDNKAKDSGEEEDLDGETPQEVELMPRKDERESEDYDKSNMINSDYIYDFDKSEEDESCKNCNKIKSLFPIPLLESILINKLLDTNDKSKPYPLKYVIKTVMPNMNNLQELDKPENQQCLRNYLQRRKRQYLTKRSPKHRNKSKKKKHKKKKKKKGKKKHRTKKDKGKKQRVHRSVNDNFDQQINGILSYVAKNQTFNETYNYMPLRFGTIAPAENQMLIAGIKNDASVEEKFLLQKILGIKSDDLKSHSVTTGDQQQSTTQATSQVPSDSTHKSSMETVKYNLNLSLNDPTMKKNFMEIMERQQNIDKYMASTNKVKRDASTSTIESSTTNNPSTESATLGLVITSPNPPSSELNVVPGLLIFPKNIKLRKRFATINPEINNIKTLNQEDINTIIKTIDTPSNEKNDAYPQAPCKDDKCIGETSRIMDALDSLNHHKDDLSEEGSPSINSPVAPTISTSSNAASSSSAEQDKSNPRNPEKETNIAKLKKDLQMVQEIQNIFDGVARNHQNIKRSANSDSIGNKYSSFLNGLISTRIWLKNNNGYFKNKAKRQNLGKNKNRRFLAKR